MRNKERGKLSLLLIDIVCMLFAYVIATWVRYGFDQEKWIGTSYGIVLVFMLLSYICIFQLYDTFAGFFKRGFLDEFGIVFRVNIILAAFAMSIFFILQRGQIYSRIFFCCFFFFNVCITYIGRQYLKVILLAYYKKSGSSKKVVILTTSERIDEIIDTMKSEQDWEYQVTGIVLVDKEVTGIKIAGIPVIASRKNVFEKLTQAVVDEVFISLPYAYNMEGKRNRYNDSNQKDAFLNQGEKNKNVRQENIDIQEGQNIQKGTQEGNPTEEKMFLLENMIEEFESMGITVKLNIMAFGLRVHEKTLQQFGGYNVLTFTTKIFNPGAMVLKRLMDILGAIIGLAFTAIITVFIAPAILIESPGPLVFSQIRIGQNGRRFKIYKFRSMYKDAEERKKELADKNEMEGLMFKMTDDPRVTKVGKFIRKTSIDELPQFLNVLKGDMSLVGTRPPTEDEFLQYETRHKRRLQLKPGITGLWQVSGRSDIENFEDVVKMDLEYIDNWSFWLDLKLLLRTVVVVIFRVGAK